MTASSAGVQKGGCVRIVFFLCPPIFVLFMALPIYLYVAECIPANDRAGGLGSGGELL